MSRSSIHVHYANYYMTFIYVYIYMISNQTPNSSCENASFLLHHFALTMKTVFGFYYSFKKNIHMSKSCISLTQFLQSQLRMKL